MAEPIQWEYRLETFGTYFSAPKDEDLQASLDGWGEEGWEVINIFKSSSGEKYTVVAKRPLSTTSRRQRSWPGN